MSRHRSPLPPAVLASAWALCSPWAARAAPPSFADAVLDNSGNTGHSAAIAAGPGNVLHGVYLDAAAGIVRYRARSLPGPWGAADAVALARRPSHLSLAVTADGTPHLAFHSDSPPCAGLCHAVRTGGLWTLSAVDGPSVSSYTAIAVDGGGRVHIAYGREPAGLNHALYDGASWSTRTVDASVLLDPEVGDQGGLLRQVAIALDAAGNPRVAYSADQPGEVRYAEHDGAAWRAPESVTGVLLTDTAGVSLAVDGGGSPRVAFTNLETNGLFYATRSASGWSVSEAVAQGPAVVPYFAAALALDGSGEPHAAFHDHLSPADVPAAAYARLEGVSWSTRTVSTAALGAYSLSLALDSSGDPHILYGNSLSASASLRYASATAAGFPPPMGGGSGGSAQAPTGMTAEAFLSSVTWRWTDNSSNETGFALYGAPSRAGPFSLVAGPGTIGPGQTSYTETELTHSTTYFRYVSAVNAGGFAPAAGIAAVTAAAPVVTSSVSGGGSLSYAAPSGEVVFSAPPGAFAGAVQVTFSVPPAFPAPAAAAGALSATGVGVEVTLSGGAQPSQEVSLSVPYTDASVAGLDESRLVLARYDPSAAAWVPLPGQADPGANRVTGKTSRFSLFQVMGVQASSGLADAKAFPNPLRPARGHRNMTFAGLPAGARVRLYTLAGELVSEISAGPAGLAFWDGANASGQAAASGVYLALIEAGGESRTLKVAVQR